MLMAKAGAVRCAMIIALSGMAVASPALADAPATCSSKEILAAFADFNRTGMTPELRRWVSDTKAQYIEPWKAFDNVYYVGICWVSAWLITSDQGHILIDTVHEPFSDQLLQNIRKVGVDPKDIKYVLMTHGHFDHAGGAVKLKPFLSNARFVMTETGWNEGAETARLSESGPAPWKMVDKDIVAKDGDRFSVTGASVRLLETPGHTFGTTSYTFDVKDGESVYHVITVGGLGLNAIKSVSQVESYIASVQKIRRLVAAPDPVAVHLSTHAFSNQMFEAAAGLKTRKPGEPHPLVNQAAILKQLDGLEANAKARLEIERKKAAPAEKTTGGHSHDDLDVALYHD
jgi:metallo-beta-lactamase class B